jgi:GxxExxY protein
MTASDTISSEDCEEETRMEFDALSNRVIGCAIEVHRVLGPGLLESTYRQCLLHELKYSNIACLSEHPVPVDYKGVRLDCGYRVDLLVEGQLIVELKSVEHVLPIHEAQLLTYMKLAGTQIGLLINFNVTQLKHGIKRYVL